MTVGTRGIRLLLSWKHQEGRGDVSRGVLLVRAVIDRAPEALVLLPAPGPLE